MAAPAGMARFLLALFTFVVVAAYGTAFGAEGAKLLRAPTPPAATDAPVRVDQAIATPSVTPTSPPASTTTARRRAPGRAVSVGSSTVFARVRGVALVLPAERVERVGFHQASDVNSLNLTPSRSAVRPTLLPSRHRPTSRHTAADIVVHPQSEIHAPVSGIVKRAGNYLLYCKDPDAFVVISPDGHPDLEVKLLHISGLRVRPGDRVVAGNTLIAKRPTKLPFESQVDAFTASPAWPHVHMETTLLAVPSATPVVGPLATGLAFSQCG